MLNAFQNVAVPCCVLTREHLGRELFREANITNKVEPLEGA